MTFSRASNHMLRTSNQTAPCTYRNAEMLVVIQDLVQRRQKAFMCGMVKGLATGFLRRNDRWETTDERKLEL